MAVSMHCQVSEALTTALAQHLSPASKRLWVGFSGGLDSTVLLAAAKAWSLAHSLPLTAVHVDHGMQPAAADFVAHCQGHARQFGVDLMVRRAEVSKAGGGPEADARAARYGVFSTLLAADDLLLLGHHRQDQIETLLLRLLRGSGLYALAGMPVHRRLARGYLLRPLLSLSKTALQHYADRHGLAWISDPSNDSSCFERNRLRHELLPVLAAHWPEHENKMYQTTKRVRTAIGLLDEVASEDLLALRHETTPDAPITAREILVLRLSGLRPLSSARRLNLLRFWLAAQGFWLAESQYQELDRQIMQSVPCNFFWHEARLAGFQDSLWLLRGAPPQVQNDPQHWQPQMQAVFELAAGDLEARACQGKGLRLAAGESLSLRFWRAGDRMLLHHAEPLVKKLFQTYRVPSWARGLLPLLFRGERLVAVADLCLADGEQVGTEDVGWQFIWRPKSDYARYR